ncbi:hypothetical protein CHS0354_036739 [Potamilus streckersoni]|uniref:DNA polymerase kappa n=1 Tax=Potamilus streckersoni TaxID=2493646 RepID=A0AAE0TDX1_9BIVA|nr:hypothetical protein CHS0354_036739 [Potamilus streckersoni]
MSHHMPLENTMMKQSMMLEEEDENSNTGEAEFKDDWEDDENWTDPLWADHLCWSKGHSIAAGHSPKKELPSRNDASHQKGLVSRMLLNDDKAGMEGLDKEKINQIIYEASKGSRFYENEQKKDEQVNRRIEEQYEKMQKINARQLKQGLEAADMLLEELERARDLNYIIVHIDMDAFYAAVEMRDNPSLRDKPMAVGGNSMLSTSNYHARKFGVRAAMPGFIGKKLCPDLVIVPPNFVKYTSVSRQIREIMAEYDSNFCPMSLDEAYLDITEYIKKREKMSDFERSFICRDSQNVSSTLCQCDLNSTLREKVLLQTANFGDGNSVFSHLFNKCSHFENGSCSECGITYSGMSSKNSAGREINSETMEAGSSGQKVGEQSLHEVKCFSCQECGKICPEFRLVTFGFGADESVREMRLRIEQRTRLTASAGIAANMMLAKVCSDKNKPNGQYRLPNTRDAVMQFIKDLPIRKISGIGKVSEKMLNSIGVHTCTDLFNQRALLYHLYSPISFNYFMRISIGMGSTTVERDSGRKSISTERTFRELSKPSDLYDLCRELCQALSEDLHEEGLKGKTVGIKLKTVAFEVKTRAFTLAHHTSDSEVIYEAARGLLKTEIQSCAPQPLRLRLMGVRISSLLHESLCKREKRQNRITGFIQQKPQKQKGDLSNIDFHAVGQNTDPQVIDQGVDIPSANKEVDLFAFKPDVEVTKHNIDNNHIVKDEGLQSFGTHMQSQDRTEKVDPRIVDASVQDKDQQAAIQDMDTMVHVKATVHSAPYENKQSAVFISKDSCVMKEKDNKDSRAVGKRGSPLKNNNGPLDSFISARSLSEQRNPSRDFSFNDGNNYCKLSDLEERNLICLDSDISDSSKQSRNEIHKTAAENVKNTFNSESSIYTAGLVTFLCPVCNKDITCTDEEKMNFHIDVCLKGQGHNDENLTGSQTPYHSKVRKQTVHKAYFNRTKENSNQICKESQTHDLDSNRRQSCTHEKNQSGSKQTEPSILSRGLEDDSVGECVLSDGQEKEILGLVCPVCYMEQRDQDLDAFNSHVDTCLSKGTISQILQEQRQNEKANLKRPSPESASSSQPSSKKKKGNNQTRSITSYFK